MAAILRNLSVKTLPLAALKPFERNARLHSKKQIGKLARSMQNFGWTMPVLVDGEHEIIAGHGRVEAARTLGMTEVPVIRIDDLDEAQVRAYRLADNKLAEEASWDEALLKIELGELIDLSPSFEIIDTGFDMAEIDLILGEEGPEEEEESPLEDIDCDGPLITRRGDLWQLEDGHRLLCGDALKEDDYDRLMDGDLARMVITDPPYNVKIAGNVSGLGRRKHGEFAVASGEMSEAGFTRFLSSAFERMASHSIDGSIHYVFMDFRHLGEVLAAGRSAYDELKNLCVWDKKTGGMGSLYRSAHELVLVFKRGTAAHVNNVELGSHGRNRTNIWRYAGVSGFGKGRDRALAMHPTVKPAAMIADAMLDCSRRGDIVLDPFGGSGTTLIAAHRTGRRARVIELDEKYCDTALRRYRRVTNSDPVHLATGRTLSALEEDEDFMFERALE